MTSISQENLIEELPFSLSDMLRVPESEILIVKNVPGPTTSVTLRVQSQDHPDLKVFVKTIEKGTCSSAHIRLGVREVRFYQFVNALHPDPLPNIPRCLNSFISPDEDAYFLVLEDLTDSHQDYQSIDFSNVASWQYGLCALAKFHRSFTQKLSEDYIHMHADDEHNIEAYINKLAQAYKKFRTDHIEFIPSATFDLLENCLPLIKRFELEKVTRVRENQVTTILHRDAHLKNFLYPREEGGETMIVDWQFWGVGIGTFDLRHLLSATLAREKPGQQEALVRYYHRVYTQGLDCDYSWDTCWSDYRKGIVDNLFMPIWQYSGFGWGYDRWGKTLESAVENFYALDCDQFLRNDMI